MMTVCWMERMTALESPDVAGGRYVTRGGGEDFFAGAAELPFTPRTSGHIARSQNCMLAQFNRASNLSSRYRQKSHLSRCRFLQERSAATGATSRRSRTSWKSPQCRTSSSPRKEEPRPPWPCAPWAAAGTPAAEKVATSIVGWLTSTFQHACLEWAEEFARSLLSSAVAVGSSLASESTTRTADGCRGIMKEKSCFRSPYNRAIFVSPYLCLNWPSPSSSC